MQRCFIALGSNQADPAAQVTHAFTELERLPQSHLQACSSLYRSAPLGPQDQPAFVNAVAMLDTSLEPEMLLDALQDIEHRRGRVRKAERWGPRILDLDLLLYGDRIIDTPRLQVPHYHMHARSFVLYPLAELAADLTLPDGTSLQQLLAACPPTDLERLPGNAAQG
ncbi:2-amino-4-hydroxy-6-hydroxymethyldihydropteridine diphosphokinase [Halopseudomonas bauzanensis]|nr:2-amino-4-hydroxy-6-hydroxymethyldihydropteridine diphosphokinase [Halopseudomonas bauzanensis]EZQ15592.1 2-amino-4-hydroxy-6-hydroxymethyldihydropteridine pyrophosphokinase [Halopseudomonas bauzanensis]SER98298.1 2-amino-4-hydroxy-6-hydroxymethyldihydropteridinediphosphokinase [Halopseudomonas bauzanensis]SFM00498.1 2-amino-4-hydroxy-6-hydroxymethyldihydropteridinediphosphokinase [Halopseudomonas bauzanensis]